MANRAEWQGASGPQGGLSGKLSGLGVLARIHRLWDLVLIVSTNKDTWLWPV